MFLSKEHWLEVVDRTPLVSIDLIVKDSRNRVLLGLRVNQPARDTWFVPGGVVRKGESLDQAFARIALDEIGLPLQREQSRFVGVFQHFYDTNFAEAPGVSTHYVVMAHEIVVPELPVSGPLLQHRLLEKFDCEQLQARMDVHAYTRAYFV